MIYRNDKIKGAMAEKGFTLETLGKKTGLNPMTISAVRNGKSVRIDTLKAVADALGLKFSELVDEALAEESPQAAPVAEEVT